MQGRLEYQVQTSQPALEYPAGSYNSGFHQIQSPMSSAMFANQNYQNWNQQGQMQTVPSNRESFPAGDPYHQFNASGTPSPAAGSDKYLIQTQPKKKSKNKSKSKSKKSTTGNQNSRIVEIPSSNTNSFPSPTVNIISKFDHPLGKN